MIKGLRENLLYLLIAHICFLAEPALVRAEGANYDPQNFTQPLSAARGSITPVGDEAIYLNKSSACELVVQEFGWAHDTCGTIDQLIFFMTPEIDNVIFSVPAEDGYVSISDWENTDLKSEISAIEESYRNSVIAQSQRSGTPIEFEGWLLYPTIDMNKNLLYYANILNWNGERTINISASIFDRHGYIPIKIVPLDSSIQAGDVKRIVEQVSASYIPRLGTSYKEYVSGDKVASYGALGVLATMLGVKYGKAASAGLMAIALIFLKKAWFILLLPFFWIRRLFRAKD